jgi:hypothetical protein
MSNQQPPQLQPSQSHLLLGQDKKLEQSCVGTQYNQQFDIAHTFCPIKIINAEEIRFHLNNKCHLVYTPHGQNIPINCPG